jgi:hypothetical protein
MKHFDEYPKASQIVGLKEFSVGTGTVSIYREVNGKFVLESTFTELTDKEQRIKRWARRKSHNKQYQIRRSGGVR